MEKLEYEKLSDYGVEFKNIISGPAPIGRILNYVILAGIENLNHKTGHRSLELKNNIASAWCSEFMVGLGLITYDKNSKKTCTKIHLTENGQKLYSFIKDSPSLFDEDSDVEICKNQLLSISKEAFDLFKKIFMNSIVGRNLQKFVHNNGTNKFAKDTFMDDYFECFKILYEGGTYNRNVRTSAAKNRVPSLLQLCKFFDFLTEYVDENGTPIYIFNFSNDAPRAFIEITPETLEKLKKEEEFNDILEQQLIGRFGIDGNVSHEVVTRNSSVQALFKNNLISKYGMKCAICGKDIEDVLIASHIKPSSQCSVVEKANCENGLLLCALHDKLFDRGLITFDHNDGKMLCSKQLGGKLKEYQLQEGFVLPEKFMTEERKSFLQHHNCNFFAKNSNDT